VTFLQEHGPRIEELMAALNETEPLEPTPPPVNSELIALFRGYSDEIERSGLDRGEMKQRILVLLDKHWKAFYGKPGAKGSLTPIERFEVTGLLSVFAAEAISLGGETDEDMHAFLDDWDVHHRGISVRGVVLGAWMLASDAMPGAG
jgi:hypothetical protein